MNTRASDAYLETQIHTASPIKLRLLLIEGAIRFLTQANEHAANGKRDLAGEATSRARDILAEILNNVWNAEGYVAKQQKSIYGYLLRLATVMQLRGQFEHATDILRVLAEERETWRQLAEIHPNLLVEKRESMISAPHTTAFAPSASIRRELSLEA